MQKVIFVFSLLAMIVVGARADVIVSNKSNNPQMDWRNDVSYQEAQDIAVLENDIRILDEEIAKCKKKKKGWTAATIVGGVGVVATGVGAIVQANKISDKRSDLADKENELRDAKTTYSNLNK